MKNLRRNWCGFFDDIGRKISLAGEGAVSKGRAFADVARLNSAVSEEEKKINNSYYQIGKLYVALHPQDIIKRIDNWLQKYSYS